MPEETLQNPNNRLHVLGVPHTVMHEDYSVCAFTAKTLKFPDIIQPFGWRVIEYSNQGSASNAREHVVVLTRDAMAALSKRKTRDEAHDADVHNAPLQDEFQRILIEKICARAQAGDIVCHVFGPNMGVYERLPNCHHVEISVGYTASPGLPFRIYESSAWMHWHHGKAGREDGSHYQWVIPSGFDAAQWPYCAEPHDYALFLGRLTLRKGMNELIEIARRVPELPIRAYGPGNSSDWTSQAPANLQFHGPVFGAERLAVVQRAKCMLMPTVFIEPFGNSGVEAQLCGVPLIASSFGAFQETVLEGVTGYRCHTLQDWAEATKLAETLDRRQISELAASKYSYAAIGKQYDWAFRQLKDLSGKGWYTERSRKFAVKANLAPKNKPVNRHIWLYIPYFGSLPNYFQIYLDSLANNLDCLTIIFITDTDLSGYELPDNFKVVSMDFDILRGKIRNFLHESFDFQEVEKDFLPNGYKLCDFRMIYPELFFDIGVDFGIEPIDFVGWGDCDLVYGRLSDFIDMTDDLHLIGGYHGHFTAMRNDVGMRRLFTEIPNLVSLLLHPKHQVADEIAFRGPLFNYIGRNGLRMYDLHHHLCDVIPECFYGLFRADHGSRRKNFFDGYNASKDINYILHDTDGRLTVVYDDGSTRPSAYCHLQKRKMSVNLDPGEGNIYIYQDGFYSHTL